MLVTAIVTTYNRPQLFRRAIRSVLAQTYEPLQIVVVEDGSDSGAETWLKGEGLDRVTYARHPYNRGLAATRNTGLRLAAGDYVAYLDDDDEWKPPRIDQQVQLLKSLSNAERERVGVVYCGVEVHSPNHRLAPSVMRPGNRGNLKEAIVRQGPTTLSSTCLFSKAALGQVGGFDETLVSSIDHDIWMALASHGYEAHAIDEPLVIVYGNGADRMTVNTAPRIQGVGVFIQKWTPTYIDWFGETEGRAFARRYFRRVVGRLAAENLVNARFVEAWQAIGALYRAGGWVHEVSASLLLFTARAMARRLLIEGVASFLKRLSGRFGTASKQ